MMNKMAIRKLIEWDGQHYKGFVDMDARVDDDSQPAATEALVFMVVAVDTSWKVPYAYFLMHTGAYWC